MTTLKPRTTSVVIYQGDDEETLGELRTEVAIAERLAKLASDELATARESLDNARMGDDLDDVLAANEDAEATLETKRAAFDAFVDEAAERAVTVRLQAIGRRRFRDLMAAHPPRKVTEKDAEGEPVEVTHPEDSGFDVNTETFPMALLTLIDPDDEDVRTVAEPRFTRKGLIEFVDNEVPDGLFDGLWSAAFFLNRGGYSDPKALRSWPVRPTSSAT